MRECEARFLHAKVLPLVAQTYKCHLINKSPTEEIRKKRLRQQT